jgi:hypothetical protein
MKAACAFHYKRPLSARISAELREGSYYAEIHRSCQLLLPKDLMNASPHERQLENPSGLGDEAV